MQSVRQIERLNATELEKIVPPNASWHTDYRDTAYIHIGGLPFELSEGDILTIFSQYGNPVHLNLVRDKETGKSRGFAFLKYEDQRSCDLAVDNLSGAGVMGRVLGVDHCRYTLKEGEVEGEGLEEGNGDGDAVEEVHEVDEGRRKRRRISQEEDPPRAQLREEIELAKLLREGDEEDPMKAYLIKEKREEVAEALKALAVAKPRRRSRDRSRDERRHRHKSRRDRSEDDMRHTERRNGHGARKRHGGSEDEDRKSHSHRSRRDDERRRRSPLSDEGERSKQTKKRESPDSEYDRPREKSERTRERSRSPDERPRRRH
ncbi:RNA-binding protein Cwf29 [Oleoguttula sp. CCFEE 5521]